MSITATEPMASGTGGRTKRRQYIVNPAFQWKYAVTIALAVFLISMIMSAVLYLILHSQARMRTLHPESYTAEVGFIIFFAGAAFSIVTGAGVGLWSILITHRMCGPLEVMRRHLQAVAGGRLPNARPLRKKDEFKEFYDTFTTAIDALKAGRQRQIDVLTEAMAAAKTAEAGADDAGRKALRSVAEQLDGLHKEASYALGLDTDDGPTEWAEETKTEREPVCTS